MTNQRLILKSHVWALVVFLLFGVIAATNEEKVQGQNQQNRNSNTNSNSSERKNANRNMNDDSAPGTSVTPSGSAAQARMSTLTAADKKFLMDAAMGGMMEVELGQLAAKQGTSESIKQFGQMMVDDHSKANTELTQLAATKGLTLPTELDQKHSADVTKMSKLSGPAFDRAYAKYMLSDHKKDVAEFEKARTRSLDPDLKAFAAKTLATLREHLTMAKRLNGTLGTGAATDSSTKP